MSHWLSAASSASERSVPIFSLVNRATASLTLVPNETVSPSFTYAYSSVSRLSPAVEAL